MLHTCQQCGKVFESNNGRNKFCSTKCSGDSRSKHERLAKIGGTGPLEIHVKTGGSRNNRTRNGLRPIWVRKSVYVLQSFLGRKLSLGECHSIIFMDGNRLNCSLANLIIKTPDARVCARCGKLKTFASNPFKVKKLCVTCSKRSRSMHLTGLTEKKVSLIKSMKGYYQYGIQVNGSSIVASIFSIRPGKVQSIWTNKSWKEVKPMEASQVWKALLEQNAELKKKGVAGHYGRIALLSKVIENPTYVEQMKALDKIPEQELNTEVDDTCFDNFTEMYQTYLMFPKKVSWTNQGSAELRRQMREKISADQKAQREARKAEKAKLAEESGVAPKLDTRNRATLKEVEVITHKLEATENEKEHLEKQLKMANQVIQSLEKRLETAEMLNGLLQEKIGTLTEEQIGRQLQAKKTTAKK